MQIACPRVALQMGFPIRDATGKASKKGLLRVESDILQPCCVVKAGLGAQMFGISWPLFLLPLSFPALLG